MPLKHEKPNDSLMDQLIDVRNAVAEVEAALKKTNFLPNDFESAPLADLLSALRILPKGTAAGARVTLRAAKVELQDFEDRHFITRSEGERDAQNNGIISKLSKHSDLGKEFRLLKSACDSALAECRRQAGTSPDEEEPPENEIRQASDPSDKIKENADIISKAMRNAHRQLADEDITDSPEKEIVSRIITDTEHLSLTTKAVVGLKTKSIWVGQQLHKAWKATPKLVEKSMHGLVVAINVSQYIHNKVSKIESEISEVLHNNGRKIALDIKNWAKNKQANDKTKLHHQPVIPDVNPHKQFDAEERAFELLRSDKVIPSEIGIHVRNIGSAGRKISLSDFSLIAECPYLLGIFLSGRNALDITALEKYKYLKRLALTLMQVEELTSLSRLTRLEYLDLSNTQVIELAPLRQLTQLEHLNLSNTQVTELAPLSGMARLEYLDLSNTQVTELAPLAGLKKLHSVHAKNLNIKDWRPLAHVQHISGRYY